MSVKYTDKGTYKKRLNLNNEVNGTGKMAQKVKMLVAKPDNRS